MSEYEKLNDAVQDIAEEVTRASIKGYIKTFPAGYFDKFEEKFEDFKHDVKRVAEDSRRAINSPIYVGVVGHYSHGKSSLLNSLLFPPKAKEILPTGNSIVTAMCSLIGFKNEQSGHDFYEIKRDGTEIQISSEEYQNKVSGNRTGSLQDVHHYKLKLNVSELNPGVFKSMSEKNIEVLDTPGLGGPYWKDEHALQSWIKEFMLLIVAVKANAINKQVADNVNPFLKYSSKPIIPVVTFWDLWTQSDLYKGIATEEDAREKACDELIKFFPTMRDAIELGRITFVSAKNYREQAAIPDSQEKYFTEDWNIDNTRNTLARFVDSEVAVLHTSRQGSSELELNRKRRVIDSCKNLCSTYQSLNGELKVLLESSRPKLGYEDDLEEVFEKTREETFREYERVVDRISEKVEDRVGGISVSGKWSQQLHEISQEISNETQQLIRDSLPDRLTRNLERGVIRTTSRYLDNESPLEKAKIKRLKDRISDICRDLVEDLSRSPRVSPFASPQGVTDWAKNMASALLDGLKTLFVTNLPMGIALIVAIFVLPGAIGFLNDIPWVGKNLAGIVGWVQAFVFAGALFTLLAISWGNVKRAKEQTASQVKEKARKQNRRHDIKDRIMPDVEVRLRDFEKKIRDTLKEEIEPLVEGGQRISEELDQLFTDIGLQVRMIEKTISELARGIR